LAHKLLEIGVTAAQKTEKYSMISALWCKNLIVVLVLV
jgi:hypothetical protein